jgi:phosphate transport system substrate-binding protein
MLLGSVDVKAEVPMLKPTAPLSSRLVISGSNSMAPMVLALGRRFSALHPGVQIEVRATGSGQGIVDVSRGDADIGMASRLLTSSDDGLSSFAIARDGVCLVVHKDNQVRNLTNRQVLDIFTGTITNWSAVGGKDAPIAVLNAPQASGTVELFKSYFKIRYADIKARSVVNSTVARVDAIRNDPNAIGYMSVGGALTAASSGAPVKLLAADGVAATGRNIGTGNFPLSRPLLLLTRGLPKGLAKDFISFSLSSQATDLVLRHDFVPYLD